MGTQETKSFSSAFRLEGTLGVLLLLFVIVCGFGCAHQKSTGSASTAQTSDGTNEKNQETLESEVPEGLVGPPAPYRGDQQQKYQQWVIVLGPGLLRSSAYLGVFKALSKMNMKVGAFVASELGALYAAMYYINGRSRAEWDHSKINKAIINDPSLLSFLDNQAEGKKMEKLLRGLFRESRLEEASTKIYVGILNKKGDKEFYSSGSAAKILRSAVAYEGLMKEGEYGWSLATREPFAVEFAKSLEIGPVLAIDLLDDNYQMNKDDAFENRVIGIMKQIHSRSEDSLKQADAVLTINVENAPYSSNEKRAELVLAGMKQTIKWCESVQITNQ